MITPSLPSNLANAVSPFSPVGKLAVGQENPEARNTPFTPVEELPELAGAQNRATTSERAAEAETRVGTERPSGNAQQQDEVAEQEQQEQQLRQEQQAQQEAQDQDVIQQLAQRDREVRAHEQAHAAVGGQLAGSPSYQFERGPDGVSYAVSGEVPISTGEVPGDPEATLANARIVQQAALAPAEPSPQDRQVAAEAAQLQQQAIQEIAAQAQEERATREAELEAERVQRSEEQEQIEEERREREEARSASEQQSVDDQARDARADVIRNNIDINQRLIDIGVAPSPTPVGNLLNQIA